MIGIVSVLLFTAVVVFAALTLVVRSLLFVAEPNEALIFAGARRLVDGKSLGFRVVRGGRSLRVPLLERVERLDLSTFTIDVAVHNAYSKGAIPLNVVGVANVKIAGEEPLLANAVERFLGRSQAEIMRIAKETLEGNLRGVLAQLTPEQVNEDKTSFAQKLIEEAEHDMHRMGLVLDTLKIQNVSDDVGYLNGIGRIRGSMVRQGAAIAEAQAQADASVQKATNMRNAELARVDAELGILREQYAKRMADARSKRAAMIAEAEGKVHAEIAQLRAEIDWQKARTLQVKNQLQADVVEPADADRRAAEEQARGEATRILEQGRAQAAALRALVEQYTRAGGAAREVLVLQKLLPLVEAISGAQKRVAVRRLTVLPASGQMGAGDNGDGALDWTRKAIATTEQLRAATGIDLGGIARRLTASSPEPTPPASPKVASR
jgi:flotillin